MRSEIQCRQNAARCVDEAVCLFEQTGRHFYLVRAYPHGVRAHIPLLKIQPEESGQKIIEYAVKAVPLLRDYGRDEEADQYEELLQRIAEDEQ